MCKYRKQRQNRKATRVQLSIVTYSNNDCTTRQQVQYSSTVDRTSRQQRRAVVNYDEMIVITDIERFPRLARGKNPNRKQNDADDVSGVKRERQTSVPGWDDRRRRNFEYGPKESWNGRRGRASR